MMWAVSFTSHITLAGFVVHQACCSICPIWEQQHQGRTREELLRKDNQQVQTKHLLSSSADQALAELKCKMAQPNKATWAPPRRYGNYGGNIGPSSYGNGPPVF
eukprot:483960-Pelagomonas_calceolata.AAC.3